jgi:hypothetical protein
LIEKLQRRVVIYEDAKPTPSAISKRIYRRRSHSDWQLRNAEKCLFSRDGAVQLRRKKKCGSWQRAMNRIQHSGVKSYVD